MMDKLNKTPNYPRERGTMWKKDVQFVLNHLNDKIAKMERVEADEARDVSRRQST